jgi:hypothetical protein
MAWRKAEDDVRGRTAVVACVAPPTDDRFSFAGQGCGAEVSEAHHEEIWPAAERRHWRALLLFRGNEREIGRSPQVWASTQQSRGKTRISRFDERAMQRFRSPKTVQKFSSVHAQVYNHFNQERHLITREIYKQRRSAALGEWRALMT